MDTIKRIITGAVGVTAIGLILLLSSCGGGSGASINVVDARALGKVVSDLAQVIGAVESGDRGVSTASKNIYPGDVTGTNPLKNGDGSWKYPGDVIVGIYTFTDTAGNYCRLDRGVQVGAYIPLTLTTWPAADIRIDHTTETVWVIPLSWEPRNRGNGAIDYSARENYNTYYFDGTKSEWVVVGAGNSKTLLGIGLGVAAPAFTVTTDAADYWSQSGFTVKTSSGSVFAAGLEFYGEDASTGTWAKKTYSRGGFVETGLFGIYLRSTLLLSSHAATYTNGVTTDSWVEDVGVVQGLNLFNLIDVSWDEGDIDSQSIGVSTKTIAGAARALSARETYFVDGPFLGILHEYGARFTDLTGTAYMTSGTVRTYYLWSWCWRSHSDSILKQMPYTTDKSGLNAAAMLYTEAQARSLFSWSCSYTVSHQTGTKSDTGADITVVVADGIAVADDAGDESDPALYSAVVESNASAGTVSLRLERGGDAVVVTDAAVVNGYLTGTVTTPDGDFEFAININSGKGVIGGKRI